GRDPPHPGAHGDPGRARGSALSRVATSPEGGVSSGRKSPQGGGEDMQITEGRGFPVDEGKLKAYASIVVDACFIVNDLKVIEGKRGLFISMPSRRRKRGGYRDVAHPLNNETRRMIEEQVLAEYQRALGAAAAGVRLAPHDDDMPDDHHGEWHEP